MDSDAFSGIVEVVAPAAGELDLFKAKDADKPSHELRIVEVEFKENLRQYLCCSENSNLQGRCLCQRLCYSSSSFLHWGRGRG